MVTPRSLTTATLYRSSGGFRGGKAVADPRGGNTGHISPPRAVKRTSLGPRAGCSYVH